MPLFLFLANHIQIYVFKNPLYCFLYFVYNLEKFCCREKSEVFHQKNSVFSFSLLSVLRINVSFVANFWMIDDLNLYNNEGKLILLCNIKTGTTPSVVLTLDND